MDKKQSSFPVQNINNNNINIIFIENGFSFSLKKNGDKKMSSSIDNITCPDCGGNAQRETDHKTGGIYDHCNNCDYEEIIAKGEEEGQKKYKLVNNTDGNVEIELKSDTEEEAIAEALEVLGWSFIVYKDE